MFKFTFTGVLVIVWFSLTLTVQVATGKEISNEAFELSTNDSVVVQFTTFTDHRTGCSSEQKEYDCLRVSPVDSDLKLETRCKIYTDFQNTTCVNVTTSGFNPTLGVLLYDWESVTLYDKPDCCGTATTIRKSQQCCNAQLEFGCYGNKIIYSIAGPLFRRDPLIQELMDCTPEEKWKNLNDFDNTKYFLNAENLVVTYEVSTTHQNSTIQDQVISEMLYQKLAKSFGNSSTSGFQWGLQSISSLSAPKREVQIPLNVLHAGLQVVVEQLYAQCGGLEVKVEHFRQFAIDSAGTVYQYPVILKSRNHSENSELVPEKKKLDLSLKIAKLEKKVLDLEKENSEWKLKYLKLETDKLDLQLNILKQKENLPLKKCRSALKTLTKSVNAKCDCQKNV